MLCRYEDKFQNLCFSVAVDWVWTIFYGKLQRKTSGKIWRLATDSFERLQLITIYERVEVNHFVFLCQLVVHFWACFEEIVKVCFFLDLPTKVGKIVVKYFGSLEVLLILLLKLGTLQLLASCWRANGIWSAANVAGVFSARS